MKYVLITGVSSGIGKELKEIYLNHDYQVIGIDLNDSHDERIIFYKANITIEEELIKVKEDHKDGVLPVYPRVGALMRRERDTRNTHTHTHTHTHTQRQHEDPARRQLSTSQGERPQENPNLLTP